jgi:hypothetical protein
MLLNANIPLIEENMYTDIATHVINLSVVTAFSEELCYGTEKVKLSL